MTSIVEFYGLMGSGKTTLSTLVAGRLTALGLNTHQCPAIDDWITQPGELTTRRQPSLFNRLPSLLVWLRAFRLAATNRPRDNAYRTHARRLAGWHRRTLYLRDLPHDDIAIQDEGAIHLILPLVMYGVEYDSKRLETLVRTLAMDNHKLFVFVHIGAETALKRIRQREELAHGQPATLWRAKQADPNDEQDVMEQMETLFDRINSAIGAVASERRLVISEELEPKPMAETISSFIVDVHRRPSQAHA